MGERTIAVIGDTDSFCPTLAEKLVNVRLLFVSNDDDKNRQLMKQLEQKKLSAEIEFINCEKEGCWEADIIAFTDPGVIAPEFIQRIKEVATQKIVLLISEEKKKAGISGNAGKLQELLPHSRVINVLVDPEGLQATISGESEEAQETVQAIFKQAGFRLN